MVLVYPMVCVLAHELLIQQPIVQAKPEHSPPGGGGVKGMGIRILIRAIIQAYSSWFDVH